MGTKQNDETVKVIAKLLDISDDMSKLVLESYINFLKDIHRVISKVKVVEASPPIENVEVSEPDYLMYPHLKRREDYDSLLHSGMFWELHPELSGEWEKDKSIIHNKKMYSK